METQSRLSDRSMSPQRKENLQEQSPQKQKGKKTTVQVKKPSQRQRSISPRTQMQTMTNLNKQSTSSTSTTSPVRIDIQFTRSIDQYYFDQLTRTIAPVPALRMNPLTTMTSTEKENLAQQCKVHEVRTQEGQCSTQTCRTVTPEAHMFAAAAG